MRTIVLSMLMLTFLLVIGQQGGPRPMRLPGRPLNQGMNLGPAKPSNPMINWSQSTPPPRQVHWGFPGNAMPHAVMSAPLFPPPPHPNGVVSVVGCGYDDMGVWRTVPMTVSYSYNGVLYNATVLSAWNPWVDVWNNGIDVGAVNTSYYLNGANYNFYVVLSTGTYYFNL